MLGMDGIEMLETYNKRTFYRAIIPIIMFTTECDPTLKDRGLKAGIHYWVIKPISA